MKKLVVGLTGASGSVYFLRLLEQLVQWELDIFLVATQPGRQVLQHETGVRLEEQLAVWNAATARVRLEDNGNLFSPVASGSFGADAMAVVPCSMSTLAEIACGCGKTLLPRTADVMLKERRKLVLVPRETPLSALHLGNMHTLAQMGATILPAMPGFYNHPRSLSEAVDFVVGKILDSLGFVHETYKRWEGIYETDC